MLFNNYPMRRQLFEQALVLGHIHDAFEGVGPVAFGGMATMRPSSIHSQCAVNSLMHRSKLLTQISSIGEEAQGVILNAVGAISPTAHRILKNMFSNREYVRALQDLKEWASREDTASWRTQMTARSYATNLEKASREFGKEFINMNFLRNITYRFYGSMPSAVLSAWIAGVMYATSKGTLSPQDVDLAFQDVDTLHTADKQLVIKGLTESQMEDKAQAQLFTLLTSKNIQKCAYQCAMEVQSIEGEASRFEAELLTIMTTPGVVVATESTAETAAAVVQPQTAPAPVVAQPVTGESVKLVVTKPAVAKPVITTPSVANPVECPAISAVPVVKVPQVIEHSEEDPAPPKRGAAPQQVCSPQHGWVSPNYRGSNPRQHPYQNGNGASTGKFSDKTVSFVGNALFRVEAELSPTDEAGKRLLQEIKEKFFLLTKGRMS